MGFDPVRDLKRTASQRPLESTGFALTLTAQHDYSLSRRRTNAPG